MALLLTRQPYAMYCETRHTRTRTPGHTRTGTTAPDRELACLCGFCHCQRGVRERGSATKLRCATMQKPGHGRCGRKQSSQRRSSRDRVGGGRSRRRSRSGRSERRRSSRLARRETTVRRAPGLLGVIAVPAADSRRGAARRRCLAPTATTPNPSQRSLLRALRLLKRCKHPAEYKARAADGALASPSRRAIPVGPASVTALGEDQPSADGASGGRNSGEGATLVGSAGPRPAQMGRVRRACAGGFVR
jgi:hypothetical protein